MSDDRRLFQGLFTGVIYTIRLGICFLFTRLTPDLHVQQTEKIRFSFLFMLVLVQEMLRICLETLISLIL